MKELTLEYGLKLIDTFKHKARKSIQRGKFADAITYIRAVAWVKYEFYIGFTDNELENFLRQISHIIPHKTFKRNEKDGIVMIDAFSKDTQGLSAQYIDAVISTGSRLLYIYENDFDTQSTLLQTLKSYPLAEIVKVPNTYNEVEKATWIYNIIMDFGATSILMHLLPDSAAECIALYALPNEIRKYQIDLTDHAFWLGVGCSDYTIEFQQIGCSLSFKERGFKIEQILLLPFYPIINNRPFEGFPLLNKDSVIIFSGGAYYKVIDSDDTFFKLSKNILDNNQNAVILFATNDSQGVLKRKLNLFNLKERFILLPFRKDIAAVFEHIDIYFNTYPVGGGLMCQYAANYAVPILNYKKESIEDSVAQKHKVSFTSKTRESFIEESIKLCTDPAYRREQGNILKNAVISSNEFNIGFKKIITNHITPYPLDFDSVNYTRNQAAKLKSLNSSDYFKIRMLWTLGLCKSIMCMPLILLQEAPHILRNKLRSLCFKKRH